MAKNATPLYDQLSWFLAFQEDEPPLVFVNVAGFQARILVRRGQQYADVTDQVPNGRRLARQAVHAFGGVLSQSGWYPPTDRLMVALKQNGLME